MAVDENSTDEELVAHIVNEIREAHKKHPDRMLAGLYVESFRYWAPSLMEDGDKSKAQVAELRRAVCKELGLKH